jgi:hypothetical protein
VHEETEAGRPGPGELLVHDRVVPEVSVSPAAELLVDVDAEQPGAPRRQPHVAGHDLVALPLLVVRGHLARDELADHAAERLVLFGEDVALHDSTVGFPRRRAPAWGSGR